MNLSPHLLAVFAASGFAAEHWTRVGRVDASDVEVLAYARAHDCVVVTRDLDFSALLAASGAGSPSVVQIRADTANPGIIGDVVIDALLNTETAEALSTGAILTIDLAGARVRLLPLR